MAQPQWFGDCQDVAEASYNKFTDRRDSQSVLSGREPCRGPANPRNRVLKSRISAVQKLSSVKTWVVRIWAVAEGIANGRLNEETNNVTSHIRYFPSPTPRSQLWRANITVTSSRPSYNTFYHTFCAASPFSKSRWPQSRYRHRRAAWQPGCKSSPASAWARAI